MKTRKTNALRLLVAVGALTAATAIALPALSDTKPTFGTIPEDAWLEDGTFDADRAPDYIVAWARDGSEAGYVAAADILVENDEDAAIPVVNDELNLVGHMVPGKGFIAVGTPLTASRSCPSPCITVKLTGR